MSEIKKFFQKKLDNVFLIGYYGGGNFGDEMLLELNLNFFKNSGTKNLKFYYQNSELYKKIHKDFGYQMVHSASFKDILKGFLTSKNIVIGGGGIWGLDFSFRNLILSFVLFFARFFLFKKVFLIGIGFYNSTNFLGRVGAFLTAKASNLIIARDNETKINFSKFSKNVVQDFDLSFYFNEISKNFYEKEVLKLEKILQIDSNSTILTIRRFSEKNQKKDILKPIFEDFAKTNLEKNLVFGILEPKEVDPEGWNFISKISKFSKNFKIFEMNFNPIALIFFLKKRKDLIKIFAPQFHMIISAHIAGCKFFPMYYDNKVKELFEIIGISESFRIEKISQKNLEDFVNN